MVVVSRRSAAASQVGLKHRSGETARREQGFQFPAKLFVTSASRRQKREPIVRLLFQSEPIEALNLPPAFGFHCLSFGIRLTMLLHSRPSGVPSFRPCGEIPEMILTPKLIRMTCEVPLPKSPGVY